MSNHDLPEPAQQAPEQVEAPKLNRRQRRSLRHQKQAEITDPLINVAFMHNTLVRDVITKGFESTYARTIPSIDLRPMAELKRIRKSMELRRAALHW